MIVLVNRYFLFFYLKPDFCWAFFFYLNFFLFKNRICRRNQGYGLGYFLFKKIVEDSNINLDITSIKIGIDSIINNIDEQMSTYKLNSEISLFNQMPLMQ
ncbi:MAG: hypothetical protein Ct9H300mP18_13850 [Candidatus Neomarinimicrobiota bacterium]|nr:MAG: hypothetical protein Ct9H300mP18_13850 [Candidatus Neomarinimicrobiota bacterium]